MYSEDEFLALSGIQHFAFCRRQWALIHIEQLWEENVHTVLGDIAHNRAHNEAAREHRDGMIVVRGLNVRSSHLGLSGICDVVEFHERPGGVPLAGEEGLWKPVPVEYKKGKSKVADVDRIQLCAQAICLEEMLCLDIPEAFLYYGTTHSRERVQLVRELREATEKAAKEMHRLYRGCRTPPPHPSSACPSCSLRNLCVPEMVGRETVSAYYTRRLGAGE